MVKVFSVSTSSKVEFVDVTGKIEETVKESGVENGICWVFIPHTTAAVTINEGADPSVRRDIMDRLDRIVPSDGNYSHLEGNSPAHIKASIIGSSEMIVIEGGMLRLGTWQSIYFCEFDGPRSRKMIVKIIQG